MNYFLIDQPIWDLLLIVIPSLVLRFGMAKTRQWCRNGIIKSKGIFNLITLMLIIAVVGPTASLFILLFNRTYSSHGVIITAAVIGLVLFLAAIQSPNDNSDANVDEAVTNKNNRRKEAITNILKTQMQSYMWWGIIPLLATILTVTLGIIVWILIVLDESGK